MGGTRSEKCLQLRRDVPGAAGLLLEDLAELSERTGYMCRGGRRPTDLYSKLGVGQRMQHTVGDLCSGLLFVLCYGSEVKSFQQCQEEGKALLQDVDLWDHRG